MPRSALRLGVVLGALASSSGGTATAQEPIGEYLAHTQPLFVEEDVETIARMMGLDAEQRAAAENLMRDGLRRSHAVHVELWKLPSPWDFDPESEEPEASPEHRAEREQRRLDEWYRKHVAAMREVSKIETEVLRDITELLSKEQRERLDWTAFDRYRRRALLSQMWMRFGSQPREMLKAAKASDEEMAAAGPILSAYEDDLDRLLVARMRFIRRMYDDLLAGGRADMTVWNDQTMQGLQIRRLCARVYPEIEAVVSEDCAARVRLARAGAELGMYLRPPETDATVVRMLGVGSLSEEQKLRLRELIDRANSDGSEILLEALKAQDRFVLSSDDMTKFNEPMQEHMTKLLAVTTKLISDMRGELTEDQVAELNLPAGTQQVDAMFKAKRSPPPLVGWSRKAPPVRGVKD